MPFCFAPSSFMPTRASGGSMNMQYGVRVSWNRELRTGSKVIRAIFDNGKPTGVYEDFMTGFVLDAAGVWGRPTGIAMASDGSLLVSDDSNGTIFRVTAAKP